MHENIDELLDRTHDSEVDPARVSSGFRPANSPSRDVSTSIEYRMRCPSCRKLYSVGSSLIGSLETLKFECSACSTRFVAHRPDEVSATFPAEPGRELLWLLTEIEILQSKARLIEGKLAALDFVTESTPESCPKCGAKAAASATECRGCGILFSKARSGLALSAESSLPRDMDSSGRKDLMDLWDRVTANWENESAHDRFVHACNKAGSLAWASANYARILDVSPHEEMAKKMKRKLVAVAEIQAQSKGVRQVSSLPFGMSSMSNLAVFMGAVVMIAGLILPSMGRMAGVGLSMILLSIGVRFVMLKRN